MTIKAGDVAAICDENGVIVPCRVWRWSGEPDHHVYCLTRTGDGYRLHGVYYWHVLDPAECALDADRCRATASFLATTLRDPATHDALRAMVRQPADSIWRDGRCIWKRPPDLLPGGDGGRLERWEIPYIIAEDKSSHIARDFLRYLCWSEDTRRRFDDALDDLRRRAWRQHQLFILHTVGGHSVPDICAMTGVDRRNAAHMLRKATEFMFGELGTDLSQVVEVS